MTEIINFMKISVWYMKKCKIYADSKLFKWALKNFPKNIIGEKIVKGAKSEKN